MARIEGFRVMNFGVLKDIQLGKLRQKPSVDPLVAQKPSVDPLTPLTAVIGKNGAGKSTLFNAFGFLADALKHGVEKACNMRGRGGFNKIRTLGQTGPITFEVYYREHGNAHPLSYEFSIGVDDIGRPYVCTEWLLQKRIEQGHNAPSPFLCLVLGKGFVWTDDEKIAEAPDNDSDSYDFNDLMLSSYEALSSDKALKESESVELQDKRRLGIATLGSLQQHPRISQFRRFIENWHLSYFTPNEARALPLAGPQRHLSASGDNLGNVVQFMELEHPEKFRSILARIAKKIPGIDKIDTTITQDNRLLLRFNDKGFKDPFYAQQMSDGTLKVFAYLLLLEDPASPFVFIEKPENGLHHELLEILVGEFRAYATGKQGGSQIFVTTHQPNFLDGLQPEEVWVLDKGKDGCSTIRRVSDNPLVRNLVKEELPLGNLWRSGYLDAKQAAEQAQQRA